MAKTIKGSELIKALEEGELKEGQQVRFTSTITSGTKIAIVITSASGLYLQDTDTKNAINTGWLTNSKIEIIEEQQDIDYWEEIANTFRKYGETLAEKFAEIGRQIDKNIKDKE